MRPLRISPFSLLARLRSGGKPLRSAGLKEMARVRRQYDINAGLSRDQLLKANLAKFRGLVAYVQRHSPYYSSIIRQRGIDPGTCVPEDFPVLTKANFIAHFDDIVTDRTITWRRVLEFRERSTGPSDLFDNRYHMLNTSGTSGMVGYYLFSPREWLRGSLHFAKTQTLGFRRRMAYIGATRGHFAGVSLAHSATRGITKLFYSMRSFDINSPTDEVIDGLNAFQPAVLCGYGGSLKVLARSQESGRLHIRPNQLAFGGEPIGPDDRRHIEHVFGARSFNIYACCEHLILGIGEPGSGCMRLAEDDLIFELQPDHIRVTNLYNRTTPLIRYRLDDVLTPLNVPDDGQPYMRVRDMIGRTEDLLEFINRHGRSDYIYPVVIAEFYVPGLLAFQIVVTGRAGFTFQVQLDHGLSDSQRTQTLGDIHRRLGELLAQKHMENVRFHIQPVDSLGPDPHTGKFRLIRYEMKKGPPDFRGG